MPRTASVEPSNSSIHAVPPVGDNGVREAEFLQFCARHARIEEKQAALRKQRKELRREMKDAGIELGVFDAILRLEAKGDDAIEQELRERIRYARFLKLPVGTQVGFFDEAPDQWARKPPEDVAARAREAGKAAGMRGKNRSDNPHGANTAEGVEWQQGYQEGQAVLYEELKRRGSSIA